MSERILYVGPGTTGLPCHRTPRLGIHVIARTDCSVTFATIPDTSTSFDYEDVTDMGQPATRKPVTRIPTRTYKSKKARRL